MGGQPVRAHCWGEVPSHWELLRLKYLASRRNDRAGGLSTETVYVGLENIESWTGRILLDSRPPVVEGAPTIFHAGDVLFGKLRPYLAKVARPSFGGVCSSELLVLGPGPRVTQTYLFYVLISPDFVRWINSMTYGTKMPRVNAEQVLDSIIPVPPPLEQAAICDALEGELGRLDAAYAKVKHVVERIKEYRAALITTAVTGKIDVRCASNAGGSALQTSVQH